MSVCGWFLMVVACGCAVRQATNVIFGLPAGLVGTGLRGSRTWAKLGPYLEPVDIKNNFFLLGGTFVAVILMSLIFLEDVHSLAALAFGKHQCEEFFCWSLSTTSMTVQGRWGIRSVMWFSSGHGPTYASGQTSYQSVGGLGQALRMLVCGAFFAGGMAVAIDWIRRRLRPGASHAGAGGS